MENASEEVDEEGKLAKGANGVRDGVICQGGGGKGERLACDWDRRPSVPESDPVQAPRQAVSFAWLANTCLLTGLAGTQITAKNTRQGTGHNFKPPPPPPFPPAPLSPPRPW